MIYHGFITDNATVIIIGADKQEVEKHYKIEGFNESHIEQKRIARFICNTGSSIISLTGLEIDDARANAIKEEIAALKAKKDKTVVKTYSDRINEVLTTNTI